MVDRGWIARRALALDRALVAAMLHAATLPELFELQRQRQALLPLIGDRRG